MKELNPDGFIIASHLTKLDIHSTALLPSNPRTEQTPERATSPPAHLSRAWDLFADAGKRRQQLRSRQKSALGPLILSFRTLPANFRRKSVQGHFNPTSFPPSLGPAWALLDRTKYTIPSTTSGQWSVFEPVIGFTKANGILSHWLPTLYQLDHLAELHDTDHADLWTAADSLDRYTTILTLRLVSDNQVQAVWLDAWKHDHAFKKRYAHRATQVFSYRDTVVEHVKIWTQRNNIDLHSIYYGGYELGDAGDIHSIS
ncbi:hypothetical protein QBC44DRAFT_399209 [Cladorrhinum sp. PSN332]|nr:hypothetical protein QBC44DRAFT_399209 [Cladorrhinum sp. PSN332]